MSCSNPQELPGPQQFTLTRRTGDAISIKMEWELVRPVDPDAIYKDFTSLFWTVTCEAMDGDGFVPASIPLTIEETAVFWTIDDDTTALMSGVYRLTFESYTAPDEGRVTEVIAILNMVS